MIVLNINHTDYRLLLQEIASAINIPFKGDDFIIVPPGKGSGTIKTMNLFNELQVLLFDASFNEPIFYKRAQSDDRYFILHFDNAYIGATFKFKVDDEELQKTNIYHSVARLTSNLFVNAEEVPARQHIKSIKILFDEKWLKKYLGLSADADVLQKYLALKTGSFDIEPLDTEYLKLMEEIWSVPQNDPLQNIFMQNRITLMVERFFTRLHEKGELVNGNFNLKEDDLQQLIKAEQLLVKDFSEAPPTIAELSKLLSVSSTKLKRNFKAMYGSSIYAYYQHQRMQKAKELLAGGAYNVKEVSEATGYINTANFIAAFKKQFDMLPWEMAEK